MLDACPDAQWRLLFALSRFGGLRCPSEHLGLRWQDVDWERVQGRRYAAPRRSGKGKASRVVPLFPELRPYLEEVWEQAEPGSTYVITRYRDSNSNLRTQLHRIIRKAGLEPWPKLFQNLRAPGKRNWPKRTRCTWFALGLATRPPWRGSIICKPLRSISSGQRATKRRCKWQLQIPRAKTCKGMHDDFQPQVAEHR